jgi:pimeloyl-ACP methyl ester carboxylesterase
MGYVPRIHSLAACRSDLFLPRMNASSFGWYKQVEHFGGLHGDEYSVLVFDNRGVGNSDTPKGPYTYGASLISHI